MLVLITFFPQTGLKHNWDKVVFCTHQYNNKSTMASQTENIENQQFEKMMNSSNLKLLIFHDYSDVELRRNQP